MLLIGIISANVPTSGTKLNTTLLESMLTNVLPLRNMLLPRKVLLLKNLLPSNRLQPSNSLQRSNRVQPIPLGSLLPNNSRQPNSNPQQMLIGQTRAHREHRQTRAIKERWNNAERGRCGDVEKERNLGHPEPQRPDRIHRIGGIKAGDAA